MKGATARIPGVANWAPSGVWEIQPLLGKLSWPRTASDPQRGSNTSPPTRGTGRSPPGARCPGPPGAKAEALRVKGQVRLGRLSASSRTVTDVLVTDQVLTGDPTTIASRWSYWKNPPAPRRTATGYLCPWPGHHGQGHPDLGHPAVTGSWPPRSRPPWVHAGQAKFLVPGAPGAEAEAPRVNCHPID